MIKRFVLMIIMIGTGLLIILEELYGISYVQNLLISPSSPAPGQTVTITFQIRGDNLACGQAFGVALSDDTTPGCGDDWLFANQEYGGTSRLFKNTTWWYDSTTVTVTSTDHTDVSGLNGGYVIPYLEIEKEIFAYLEKNGVYVQGGYGLLNLSRQTFRHEKHNAEVEQKNFKEMNYDF